MKTVKIINGNLNVRKEPSIKAEIINVIPNGEVVKITPYDEIWAKYGTGYIMSKFTEPASVSAKTAAKPSAEEELVSAAKELKSAAKEVKSAAKKTTAKKKTAAKK